MLLLKQIQLIKDYLFKLCEEEKINLAFTLSSNSYYDFSRNEIGVGFPSTLNNFFLAIKRKPLTITTEKQLYSLAHELGHYFVYKNGLDNPEEVNKILRLNQYHAGLTKPDKATLIASEVLAWNWAQATLEDMGVNLTSFEQCKKESLDSYYKIVELKTYQSWLAGLIFN